MSIGHCGLLICLVIVNDSASAKQLVSSCHSLLLILLLSMDKDHLVVSGLAETEDSKSTVPDCSFKCTDLLRIGYFLS